MAALLRTPQPVRALPIGCKPLRAVAISKSLSLPRSSAVTMMKHVRSVSARPAPGEEVTIQALRSRLSMARAGLCFAAISAGSVNTRLAESMMKHVRSVSARPAPGEAVTIQALRSKLSMAAAGLCFAAISAGSVNTRLAETMMKHVRSVSARPAPGEEGTIQALRSKLSMAGAGLCFAAISAGSVNTPLTVVASGMAKWLELYSGVLMLRVLLSWFPNIPWERQPLQAIRDMCDPYLNLFRNIIPPLFNALDVSPLLAFLVLGTLTAVLNTAVQA